MLEALSIIIPFRNDPRVIYRIKSIRDHLDLVNGCAKSVEIVLVGDLDDDALIAEEAFSLLRGHDIKTRYFTGETNGKGAAVKLALIQTLGRSRLVIDSDDSISVENICSFVKAASGYSAEFCHGIRIFAPTESYKRRIISLVHQLIFHLFFLKSFVQDLQCPAKLLSPSFGDFLSSNLSVSGGMYDGEMFYHCERSKIVRQPISVICDPGGYSVLNLRRVILNDIFSLLRLRFRLWLK